MNVLLLDRVTNLGALGDEVEVRNGYARNFLIPFGKAMRATSKNREIFAQRRAELEAAAVARLEGAEKRAALLEDLEITILARVGEGGKLYGSVGPIEIANTLTDLEIEVNRSEVRMPEGPIRETGEYSVEIHVHADVSRTINVLVVAE